MIHLLSVCAEKLTRSSVIVADQSLEILAGLLNDGNIGTVKVVVQCFPTVYALLFRSL